MVATMVILTGVSLKMASSIIEETTNDEMTAQLDYQESKVQEIVTEIETKANDLSRDISLQYKKLTPADMENSIIAMTDSGDAETGDTANQIQQTITGVRSAVDDLVTESTGVIDFLNKTVTPDYNKFVNVAKQYSDDAVAISKITENITNMTERIEVIMHEVSQAIESIANSTQSTASSSANIIENLSNVNAVVEDVSGMAEENKAISEELSNAVSRFKL